ncbi:MAG: CheB methylesterase domain-containing protein [Candidatus Kariarchaeaceae archaeon]|jgi:two-component system chemotaxis response regulator CheB
MSEIKNILSADREIEIAATFLDDQLGFEYCIQHEINIVVLNNSLQNQTAYSFVMEVMANKPIPCLILDTGDAKEIDHPRALDYGIVDVLGVEYLDEHLVNPSYLMIKIKILSKLKLERFTTQIQTINQDQQIFPRANVKPAAPKETIISKSDTSPLMGEPSRTRFDSIIVIGASTGGPGLLVDLVSQLPVKLPPVVIVQHMPKGFVGQFAKRMDSQSKITVKKAEDGDQIEPGNVYVAPGGTHLELVQVASQVIIRLTLGNKVNFVRPAVDVTLNSAVKIYGDRVISVILSGMGSDGLEGSRSVKKEGGRVIALNESDSLIYGMNKNVIEAGIADFVSSLDDITFYILRFLKKWN